MILIFLNIQEFTKKTFFIEHKNVSTAMMMSDNDYTVRRSSILVTTPIAISRLSDWVSGHGYTVPWNLSTWNTDTHCTMEPDNMEHGQHCTMEPVNMNL